MQLFGTTYSQRRLLYLNELNTNRQFYNSTLFIHLGDEFDYAEINSVFNALIKRHEILRTTFQMHNDHLVQAQHESLIYKIKDGTDEIMTQRELENIKSETDFDFSTLPLFNAIVKKVHDSGYWLFIEKHLLLADYISDNILVTDFKNLYAGKILPDIEFQYLDFTLYQNDLIDGDNINEIKQLWIKSFKQENGAVCIPMERDDTKQDISQANWKIEGDVYLNFIKHVRQNQLDIQAFLLSIFYVLLHRYCQQKNIVISCVFPGRNHEEFMQTCGYFENIVPIKKEIDETKSFSEFYKSVLESHKLASMYQEVPFDFIVESLRDIEVVGLDSLFNIGFRYHRSSANVNTDSYPFLHHDVMISCFEQVDSSITITFNSVSEIVSHKTIKRFEAYYQEIFQHVTSSPDVTVADINIVPIKERKLLLQDFNADKHDFDLIKPIQLVFEEQVTYFPKAIAVCHNNLRTTYETLNNRANKIAWLLQEIGVKKNTFVGVYQNRDTDLIIGLLGILKAGGAYIPFDIKNPIDRTENLMNDSQMAILITKIDLLKDQYKLFSKLSHLKYIICYEDLNEELKILEKKTGKIILDRSFIFPKPESNLANNTEVSHWAYMLYTSGSTGKPKGAITRHNGALNHIFAEYRALDLEDGFNFLQSANISSDISVWQILAPLLKGGSVVIIDQPDLLNYKKLIESIRDNEVTIIEFVPSFLNGWLEFLEDNKENLIVLPQLKWVMMVGEEVPVSLVNRWFDLYPTTKVLNGYGPCEASDDIAQYPMTSKLDVSWKKVPIGKPLTNLNIFILDKNENLLPLGAIGELGVSGIGVGAGYWNKPDKTAENFITNHMDGALGDTIYKTGDLARWLTNGHLEFCGRVDDQVKIRGFRVETGEVETVIKSCEAIAEVAVMVKEDSPVERSLIAFLVVKKKLAVNIQTKSLTNKVRSLCEQYLPAYMVPSQFRLVEQVLTNLSDKVDKKKMLSLEFDDLDEEKYVAPRNETERKLCKLWEAILNKKQVGIQDNFFFIGGHSLKATQLISKIFKTWNVNLRLMEVFNNPTIETLAVILEGSKKEEIHLIEATEEQDYYALSHAQKRIWIMDKAEENRAIYNIPSSYMCHGTINFNAFEKAFEILITRHESLRTSFFDLEGVPRQRIHNSFDKRFKIEYVQLQKVENKLQKAEEYVDHELVEPFDLQTDSLLRVKLIQLEADEFLLLFTMHHIISDGWSSEVLQNEFFKLYSLIAQNELTRLAPLKIQYRDFVKWHNKYDFLAEEEYWLKKLTGANTFINLPSITHRSSDTTSNGALIEHKLGQTVLQSIKEIAIENNTSLSNVFLSIFNILLYKLSGQQDIPIGVAVANRDHPDTEFLIGFFVNVLVIRTVFDKTSTFSSVLQQVTTNMAGAYDYQNYPLDILVSKLNPSRQNNQQPLFNVMYAFQNYSDLILENDSTENNQNPNTEDFTIIPYNKEIKSSKFDLTLYVFDHVDTIQLAFEYNTDLFEEATIGNTLNSYVEFLEHICGSYVGV